MRLKFISLNLWKGGILFDEILSFLTEENADIVALQEVNHDINTSLEERFRSFDVLAEKLGYKYKDFVPAFGNVQEEGNILEGNAVLSKFPISESSSVFLNGSFSPSYVKIQGKFHDVPRNMQRVLLETPAGEVNIFNFQGVWDMDGDNYSDARRRMTDVILREIKEKKNVILAGDTNARPTNLAIRRISEKLYNVFGHELTTTFNMLRKTHQGYATAVVDMVFVSPEFRILSKKCPNIDISDHLPLVVDLEIDS